MSRKLFAVMMAVGTVMVVAPESFATVVTQTVGPYSISFYNSGDTDGIDTGTQNWTATQEADVAASISNWTARISNTAARQIDLHMFWSSNLGSGVLGSSYNPILSSGGKAYTRTEYVWRQNANPGSGSDASIAYDPNAAGYAWNFGTGVPSGSQIDFRSVVTHEIGHCLGFVSSYQSASDTFWSGGLTAMDKYLRDSATGGNAPSAGATGTPGNFNQTANPAYFIGPNAEAANGGQPVAIYAPATYSAGSSLTHVDDATFSTDLMSHAISLGQERRDPSAIDMGMMQDFGWALVPEPGVIAILVGGSSMLMIRRRKQPAAA